MPTVLIADACKPSLVMSSEVFKDKIAGCEVIVATTGRHCLETLAEFTPDMVVVDFDLPDSDGISLVAAIRKLYKGPILLTAYPDQIVKDAVEDALFAFNDAGGWVPKPVKFDVLSDKIDQFLLDKHRLGKRFDLELTTLIIGKGAGRGKRAPKVSGKILNLSLGGACIELDEPMIMKGGEEMTVAMPLPPSTRAPRKAKTVAKKKATSTRTKTGDAKIKCTVAWVDKKSNKVGFAFNRLTEVQRQALEGLLRDSYE